MRVVRVVPELDFGGVETRAVLLAERAHAHGIDLHVVAFHKEGRAAEAIRAAGVPVHLLHTSPSLRNPRATRRLAQTLRRLAPAIVHAAIVEANVHTAAASLLVPVPRLLVEEVGMPSRRPAVARALAGVYAASDGVVAVSDRVLRALEEREGLVPGHGRRVHNTARPSFFEPLPARAAPVHRLITVGRLVPIKNQQVLLQALASDPRLARCHLTIAGDGPLRDALASTTQALGLSDRVTFSGYVGDPGPLLDTHGTFVLPSFAEGFGIALLEAMARGLLCLASNTSSLHEVLPAGSDALLFDPHDPRSVADAIAGLLARTSAERRTLRDRLRRHAAATFSPEAHLRSLAAVYADVGEGPPTSRAERARRFARAIASFRPRGTA
jgi:glycosyltransferase involved in cell wall biosynthesis